MGVVYLVLILVGTMIAVVALAWGIIMVLMPPEHRVLVRDVVPHDTYLLHRGNHRSLFTDLRVGDKVMILNPRPGYRRVTRRATVTDHVKFGHITHLDHGRYTVEVVHNDKVAAVVPHRRLEHTVRTLSLSPSAAGGNVAVTDPLHTRTQPHYIPAGPRFFLSLMHTQHAGSGPTTYSRDGQLYSVRTGVYLSLPSRITIHSQESFSNPAAGTTSDAVAGSPQPSIQGFPYTATATPRPWETEIVPFHWPILPLHCKSVQLALYMPDFSDESTAIHVEAAARDARFHGSQNKVVRDILSTRGGILSPVEQSQFPQLHRAGDTHYGQASVTAYQGKDSQEIVHLRTAPVDMVLRWWFNINMDTGYTSTSFQLTHRDSGVAYTIAEVNALFAGGLHVNSVNMVCLDLLLDSAAHFWWYPHGAMWQSVFHVKVPDPPLDPDWDAHQGFEPAVHDTKKIMDQELFESNMDYRNQYCGNHPCTADQVPLVDNVVPGSDSNALIIQGIQQQKDLMYLHHL